MKSDRHTVKNQRKCAVEYEVNLSISPLKEKGEIKNEKERGETGATRGNGSSNM